MITLVDFIFLAFAYIVIIFLTIWLQSKSERAFNSFISELALDISVAAIIIASTFAILKIISMFSGIPAAAIGFSIWCLLGIVTWGHNFNTFKEILQMDYSITKKILYCVGLFFMPFIPIIIILVFG